MAVIGLDLGGTKLAGALFDDAGSILDRRDAELQGRGGKDVGKLVTEMAHDLVAAAGRRGVNVMGIGAAVPGIAYHATGNVWAPNIPGWQAYPLRAELEGVAGSPRRPVVVDSDRACSILGERWRGAARGCDHAIFVAVGTGIGLGVLVNGKVLRGAHDIAGATGWMALDRPFREKYAACGSFEYSASGEGLARVARDLLLENPVEQSELRSLPPEKINARALFKAYENGDPIGLRTLENAIAYWGMATANYVSLFDPDRIIFGGGVFGPALRFLPAIRKEAEGGPSRSACARSSLSPRNWGPTPFSSARDILHCRNSDHHPGEHVKHTRLLFVAACAGMLLFGMAMLSLGTVNTFLVHRFKLDALGVASLAGLLPFGILAGSLIFGPVVDRFGYKIPLTISAFCVLTAFETIAMALSFLAVQAAFFFVGLGGGVLNGGTNALVADISGENRGSRLSILGVFFGIGALGMPMVTGLLLQKWTHADIIAGFGWAILLPILLFLLIRFPDPKQRQGFPIAAGAALVRDGTLLLLSMILFFESAVEGLVNNWAPAFLQNARQFGVDESLYVLTILLASLTITRLVLGGVVGRLSRSVILGTSLAASVAGAVILATVPGGGSVGIAMVLIGIGTAAPFPVVLGAVGGLFPNLSGTAFGIALVIALTGNTIINTLLGAVSGAWGISVFPWYLLVTLAGLGVFLLLGLRSLAHRLHSSRG